MNNIKLKPDFFQTTLLIRFLSMNSSRNLIVPELARIKKVREGCSVRYIYLVWLGLHAVADIYCDCCKTTLGWKYEHAFESSQKYKEGKFIIELAHMIKVCINIFPFLLFTDISCIRRSPLVAE